MLNRNFGAQASGAMPPGAGAPMGAPMGASAGAASPWSSGLSSIGSGIGQLMFGGKDPSKGAFNYLNQIPDIMNQYMNPYINAGTQSLSDLEKQYGDLINDPAAMLNKIGAGYQQSPGFKFALDQALQGAGHAAAAGGMAGSPQAQQQAMQIGTQLGNQDYYNWLNQATGMYNTGLQGLGGITGMGFQGATNISDMLSQMLAQEAAYKYAGQINKNQSQGGGWGSLLGGIGSIIGGLL